MANTYESYRTDHPNRSTKALLYSSGGLKQHAQIRDRACCIVVLQGFNPSEHHRYFQLFEAEAPKTNAIPASVISVPPGGTFSWNPAQGGRVFERLWWAVSTTPAKYTAAVGEGFWVEAEGLVL